MVFLDENTDTAIIIGNEHYIGDYTQFDLTSKWIGIGNATSYVFERKCELTEYFNSWLMTCDKCPIGTASLPPFDTMCHACIGVDNGLSTFPAYTRICNPNIDIDVKNDIESIKVSLWFIVLFFILFFVFYCVFTVFMIIMHYRALWSQTFVNETESH